MAEFKPCPVDDCGRRIFSEGMCWPHLKEVRRDRGDLCGTDGCDHPRFGAILCPSCTRRQGRANGAAKVYEVACEWCGRTSKSERKRRFCSSACGSRGTADSRSGKHPHNYNPDRHKLPVVHPEPAPLTWLSRRHPVITPRDHPPLNSGALFVFGPCEWCGEAFMALASHFDGRSRTCSKRCARGRQRAKYDSRFRVSPKRRQQIYERDRWTCQLCKEPVDRDAHYLDDWAPTLDHIIPQSHVLVPDHSDANLRTAHRWCNSVRGDERFHSVEDLAS